MLGSQIIIYIFFFYYTVTTVISTYCHPLSLHDALPIWIGRAAAVQDAERDPVPRRAADAKVEPLVKVRIPVADDLEIGCIPVYRQYPDIARIKAGRNRQRHFAFTSTVSPDRPGKSLNKAAANRLARSEEPTSELQSLMRIS